MSAATVSRETHEASDSACCDHDYASIPVSRETDDRKLSPLARLLLLPLRGYRRFISPAMAPRCRYYPSCSAYAEEAIREVGAIRGTILASWRLLRCNPFSNGGIDHVSERRLFRPRTESPKAHT